MSKTIRLNDLQLVLLAGAAERDNGSLIPLPDAFTTQGHGIAKAIASLLRRQLVEEKPADEPTLTWRTDGESAIGLFITAAGLIAIGVGSEEQQSRMKDADSSSAPPQADAATAADSSNPARSGSKIAGVVTLLERAEGATLDEMVKATGWLPHTTRAALTGLRKKGRTIEKSKRDDLTCYRIAAGA